jgi:RND family efflux transporter MFP subunit
LSDLRTDLASLRIERRARAPAWRKWTLVLVVLALLGAGGYTAWTMRDSFAAVEVAVVRPQVVRPGEGPGRVQLLMASGYIVARRKAVVSAKIQGRLSELHVEEGSKVAEGDVIARLESIDQEAQVKRANAAVERADADLLESRRQLRLTEELIPSGAVSKDELEAAQSRVRIAEAALKEAQGDLAVNDAYLQNTYIRAPFGGVVIKKMAEVGESVAPIPPGVNVSTSSGAIVVLADMDTLEMEGDVSESRIGLLGEAQPAEVAVEAFPGRAFPAALRQIIPSADRTKATVLVKVTLLEKDEHLKPEMSARVTFFKKEEEEKPAAGASARPPRIMIPAEAVVIRGGEEQVVEVVQGKAAFRRVRTGERSSGQLVVEDGLSGVELLVANPPETLADGDAVKVK